MGLSGRVPRRVDAATKAGLLELIDHALESDWTVRDACRLLELSEGRAWRWLARRQRDEPGSTKGLVTSAPTTSTKDAARPSAKPAATAWNKPGNDALPGTDNTGKMTEHTDPTMLANRTPIYVVESDTRHVCV